MALQPKDERINKELPELFKQNPAMAQLIACLTFFVEREFKKDVVVTSVYRTAQEQADLYKDVPEDKKVLNSPHCRWEAFDFRTSIFTPREKERLLTFLNCFTYQGGQRKVFMIHTIAGNVEHAHVQFR